MNLFKKQYRIVRDGYLGYEVQKRYLLFPFWFQCNYANTHKSIEDAKTYVENDKNKVVDTSKWS